MREWPALHSWQGLLLGAAIAIAVLPVFRALGLETGAYFITMMLFAIGLALWSALREGTERRHPDEAEERRR